MLTNQAVFSADGQSIMYIDETSKVVMVERSFAAFVRTTFSRLTRNQGWLPRKKKTQNKILLELFDLEVKVVFFAGHVKLTTHLIVNQMEMKRKGDR